MCSGRQSYLLVLIVVILHWTGVLNAQIQFQDVTYTAGVPGDPNSIYSTDHAWGDYDNDGDLDLFITNWGTAADEAKNLLLRNTGGLFADVTAAAGFHPQFNTNNSYSCVWGDYDNDGDLDLYVVNFFEQDELHANQGNGTFVDVSIQAGIDVTPLGNSTVAAWADYDRDGDLDVYLCKYYAANELYANNGDGTFTLVTAAAGVGDIRDSEGAVWGDYDEDGDDDLYVVNREQDNSLYRNDADGTFTEVGTTLNADNSEIGKNGIWGDYNLDGFFDIFLANIGGNVLLQNNSGLNFQNVSASVGVQTSGSGWESWDAAWGDYDADSDLDLLVVGGVDAADESVALYFNLAGAYVDVTDNSGDLFRGPFYASSCSFADYDGDGDMDIFMTATGDNALFANPVSTSKNLKVQVRGKGTGFSNTFGIGSTIRINEQGEGILLGYQQIASGSGPLEANFYLPESRTYEVHVTFPNGSGTTLTVTTTVPNALVIQEP